MEMGGGGFGVVGDGGVRPWREHRALCLGDREGLGDRRVMGTRGGGGDKRKWWGWGPGVAQFREGKVRHAMGSRRASDLHATCLRSLLCHAVPPLFFGDGV